MIQGTLAKGICYGHSEKNRMDPNPKFGWDVETDDTTYRSERHESTSPSIARDAGLILGQGTKILHDAWYGKKIKIKEALGLDIESNSNSMP